jgi:probable rRNA maturation factor
MIARRIDLAVQRASAHQPLPDDEDFERWVRAALPERETAELTIRIVDEDESRALNRRYRDKDRATNVLSFPADLPGELGIGLLGDIVICAPRVAAEAREQGKAERAHWAHLTVHGVLHLLGYDHQRDSDAKEMEELEVRLLAALGHDDPYA